jgi:hypothetical protein
VYVLIFVGLSVKGFTYSSKIVEGWEEWNTQVGALKMGPASYSEVRIHSVGW